MPNTRSVTDHYARGGLLAAIRAGVERLGKTTATVSIEDLAPVDEFHIGGRAATQAFMDQLALVPDDQVLDVGCGLGGASRFAARTYGCRVTGIDLTADYVSVGNTLCDWLALDASVRLAQGNALAMPFHDDGFDKAYMLHVGMNIADKAALAVELGRVLKPGGLLGIYDVMATNDEDLLFPLPWASTAEASSVASAATYTAALRDAGFEIIAQRDRRAFALKFFARLQAGAAARAEPPPLGLHLLMGETAPAKLRNLVSNMSENRVAPIEMLARKHG